MRTAVFEDATRNDPDELLTTGEAAKILSSSRQHVVDLTNRGDLPYATTGRHRRIRRGDLDAFRTRTERLTRDQRRSLWLAHAVAGRIVADPERARNLARANLVKSGTTARGSAVKWLERWVSLVEGPVEEMLATLTASTPYGREMRQNSPFAAVLTDEERLAVLDAFRRFGVRR